MSGAPTEFKRVHGETPPAPYLEGGFAGVFALNPRVAAQDNYEIQVYGSEATPKNVTMVEIHSNFTVDGSKQVINGVLPSNPAMHGDGNFLRM